ncbi:MAG: hypothetical protein RL342_231 [Pseudomonadota bacterium]
MIAQPPVSAGPAPALTLLVLAAGLLPTLVGQGYGVGQGGVVEGEGGGARHGAGALVQRVT